MAVDMGAERRRWSTAETKLAELNFVVCLEWSILLNSGPFCLEFCVPSTHPASPRSVIFLCLPPENPRAQLYKLLSISFLSQHPVFAWNTANT